MKFPGIHFDPTQSALGLLLFGVGVAVAIITIRLKTRSDNTTAQNDVSRGTWERVLKFVDKQEEENQRLREEIEGLRNQVTLLIKDKADSDREMHHKDAIIADLSEALMAYQRWAAEGAQGRPPAIAWHLAEHLERLRR